MNLIGKLYDIESFWNNDKRRYEEQEVFNLVKDNKVEKFLEVGAGTCRFSAMIKEKNPEIEVYATDISEKYLENGGEKADINTFVIESEILREKFKENTFDTILMTDTLHHHKDRIKTLENIYAILKPNGVFIIRELNRLSNQFYKYRLVDKTDLFLSKLQGLPYIHPEYFSKEELINLLKLVGFSVESTQGNGNMITIIKAIKNGNIKNI